MPAQSLLRRETKYGVWKESRPLRPSRFYFGTEGKPYRYFSKSWWLEAQERSEREPVKLHEHNGRTWWRFKGDIFTRRRIFRSRMCRRSRCSCSEPRTRR
jgi:hypothetical protein